MKPMLFVGERRSGLARKRGVTWINGRLAAKQLFDALLACGVNPAKQYYCNIYERTGRSLVRQANGAGVTVVAMGRKVQREIAKMRVPFIPLVHPAARGAIRLKRNYTDHVRTSLTQQLNNR
jgi:hypothetical protein